MKRYVVKDIVKDAYWFYDSEKKVWSWTTDISKAYLIKHKHLAEDVVNDPISSSIYQIITVYKNG